MSAENKATIDRLTAALNESNLDVIDAVVVPNFIGHNPLPPEPIRGPEGLKGFFATIGMAMPDIHYPSWTLIAEGDLVAIHMKGEPSMKNLTPVLILVALALFFGVASAEPPGPNAGWLHLYCEGGLNGDVWFGSQHSQAFHMAEGPILHPRSGWVCLTEALCGDQGWIPWFSMPGEAKGVDTIVCYADVDWSPKPVRHLKIEVDVAPPD